MGDPCDVKVREPKHGTINQIENQTEIAESESVESDLLLMYAISSRER